MRTPNVTHLLISFVLLFHASQAQNPPKRTDECNCQTAFQDLTTQLEENYIGLAHMKLRGEDQAYKKRKLEFAQQSAEIEAKNCTEFLTGIPRFFGRRAPFCI